MGFVREVLPEGCELTLAGDSLAVEGATIWVCEDTTELFCCGPVAEELVCWELACDGTCEGCCC